GKAAAVVLLLSVPLLVITALPRFFELAGSIPASGSQPAAAAAPAFRLVDAAPTNSRARFAALEETPPPTLAPPALTAPPQATPRPTPTGRVVIGNTGGVGAVLRAEPVTGRVV